MKLIHYFLIKHRSLGCKWVLRKKLKPDGTIDKFKARLVAKGFKQKADVDFFDTFSLVTRITSNRLLIAVAAIYDLKIHQMEVKIAFLNGDLDGKFIWTNPKDLYSLVKKVRCVS